MIYNDIYFDVISSDTIEGDIFCNTIYSKKPQFWFNVGHRFISLDLKVLVSNKLNKKLYPNFLKEYDGKLVIK